MWCLSKWVCSFCLGSDWFCLVHILWVRMLITTRNGSNGKENCNSEKQRDQCSIYQMKLTRETKWDARRAKWKWIGHYVFLWDHSSSLTHSQISLFHFRPFDCAFSRIVLVHTCIYKFQINLIVKQRLLSECYFSVVRFHHLAAWFPCAASDNIRRAPTEWQHKFNRCVHTSCHIHLLHSEYMNQHRETEWEKPAIRVSVLQIVTISCQALILSYTLEISEQKVPKYHTQNKSPPTLFMHTRKSSKQLKNRIRCVHFKCLMLAKYTFCNTNGKRLCSKALNHEKLQTNVMVNWAWKSVCECRGRGKNVFVYSTKWHKNGCSLIGPFTELIKW